MRIVASVAMLDTAEGGRIMPIVSGYRPQFFTTDPPAPTSAFIELLDNCTELAPGQSGRIAFELLAPDMFEHELAPGTLFRFREGPRIVAAGTIETVEN